MQQGAAVGGREGVVHHLRALWVLVRSAVLSFLLFVLAVAGPMQGRGAVGAESTVSIYT